MSLLVATRGNLAWHGREGKREGEKTVSIFCCGIILRALLLPPSLWLELTMELGKCSGATQALQLMDGLQCCSAIQDTLLNAPDEELILGPLSTGLV